MPALSALPAGLPTVPTLPAVSTAAAAAVVRAFGAHARRSQRLTPGDAVAVAGDGAVARAVRRALERDGGHEILAVPLAIDDDAWLARCGVCVAAVDEPSAEALLWLNARCLERAVALVPGLAMGAVGQVGPVVRGGLGPCLRCAELRLLAATGRSCLASYGPPERRTIDALASALTERLGTAADPRAARMLTFHHADGTVTRHPVLRTRRCPDCSDLYPRPRYRDRGRLDLRERDDRDHDQRILTLRSILVDPVTGPISSLETYAAAPPDPAFTHCVATLVDEGWHAAGFPEVSCGGTSADPQAAEAAAMGEALERASAVLPRRCELVISSFRAVEADAVDPRTWDLFDAGTRAQDGFPYVEPSATEPISWVWGWSLTGSRPVLVPAARTFIALESPLPGDLVDCPPLSGFAAGATLEQATLRALLEVVERDAFTIAWANRLPLRHVVLDPAEAAADAFGRAGLEARCGLVELDLGAAVAIAMVRSDRAGDAAAVVAAAADPDPAHACRRALQELAANRLHVRHALVGAGGQLPSSEPDEVRDEVAHGLLYARHEMLSELDCWWQPRSAPELVTPAPCSSTWQRLVALVRSIAEVGLEVLVVDLTPPEMHELGLWAVKALVPGAYPINFDSRWPHLGGARILDAPVRAGLRGLPLAREQLNRVPHPFP